MAHPKHLRTASAAIPVSLHSRLDTYARVNNLTRSKAVSNAISNLVSTMALPAVPQKTAIATVMRVNALVSKFIKRAPRMYPPLRHAAALLVLREIRDAAPSYLGADGGGPMSVTYGRILAKVIYIRDEAKADTAALDAAWRQERAASRKQADA
jgi:hypothetical protein